MRKTMAISAASGLLGYAAVYFLLLAKPAPAPEQEQPPAAAAEPAEPIVLAQVIDVTDLDPLLNPPPTPEAGVPFDTADAPEAVTPVTAPAPIPLAAD